MLTHEKAPEIPDYIKKSVIKWTITERVGGEDKVFGMDLERMKERGGAIKIWNEKNENIIKFDIISIFFKTVEEFWCTKTEMLTGNGLSA